MKTKFLFFLLPLFISCENEYVEVCEKINDLPTTENEYAIPVDSAIAYLQNFLTDFDESSTRSYQIRRIKSITPIKYKESMTRSENNESINCENLVYIANFENEQGYAILAADNRINEKVIAITETGTLSDKTVYTAMEIANSDRFIFNEYPTTGPGFYTTPETGDELFINPNTVVLYDDKEKDTLVGNFESDDSYSLPELFSSYLCTSYSINEIQNHNQQHNEIDKNIVSDGDSNSPRITADVYFSPWKDIKVVNPILADLSSWHQRTPFNDLYPLKTRRKDKQKVHAPAGCFPLAISKIMTHFEYPQTYVFNGYTIDWKELKRTYNSEIGKKSAAHLLRGISEGCRSWYFRNGTFTFPSRATKYMRTEGFKNSHLRNYEYNEVTKMLNDGCPIIICSIPGRSVTKSHSWNIDGYKIRQRTVTTKTFKDNVPQPETTETETSNMVHCDFGWGGKCNGYFVSDIFKVKNPNNGNKDIIHYNNFLKILTYEKPIK